MPYEKSLQHKDETTAGQWHPTLNGDVRPEEVSANENTLRWWLCSGKLSPDGTVFVRHAYQARTYRRAKGSGCPYCSRRPKKVCPYTNSLQARKPEIARELHPTLNSKTADEIIAGSDETYWWLCPGKLDTNGQWHQHEYPASPASRMRGTGCPCCANKTPCPRCNTLSAKHSSLAKELHPTLNNKTAAEIIAGESRTKYWWLCPGKLDTNGQWHQHEYEASPASRIRGSGCPCCSTPAQKPCPRCNTLSAKRPDLARELHPTRNVKTADEIIAGEREKYWWLCPGKKDVHGKWHQHEYPATADSRIRGSGCPCCSTPAQKPCPRCNTLSVKRPDLARELHPTRNAKTADEIIAGGETVYWWLCPGKIDADGHWHQHEYPARACDRIDGRGCPDCYEIQRVRHWPQSFQRVLTAVNLRELFLLQPERERRRWLATAGAAEHANGGARIIFEGIIRGFVSESELRKFVQAPNPEALTRRLRQEPELVKLVEREPVPERIKKQVRARDRQQCCLCSSTEKLEVDHLLPVTLGGTNNRDNLWTLCRPCNAGPGGKHAKLPDKQMLKVWVATGRGKPACWDDVWEGSGETPPAWPDEPGLVAKAA